MHSSVFHKQARAWIIQILINPFLIRGLFQDNYGMPIITAPIRMTAKMVKKSQELTVGEWMPTKGFMNKSFEIQNKTRVIKIGKVNFTILYEYS